MIKVKMKNVIALSLLCFITMYFTSCLPVGEYYTDPNNKNIEDIEINADKNIKDIGFAAYSKGNEFASIIFFKLIDTIHFKNYQINEISVQINNVKDDSAEKHLLLIDKPGKIRFQELSDIPELSNQIQTGLPMEFTYKFNKEHFSNLDIINIQLTLNINENGSNTTLEKNFKMKKHTRYKSVFLNFL